LINLHAIILNLGCFDYRHILSYGVMVFPPHKVFMNICHYSVAGMDH